eukprot:Gb_19776 [translate_table: standard]
MRSSNSSRRSEMAKLVWMLLFSLLFGSIACHSVSKDELEDKSKSSRGNGRELGVIVGYADLREAQQNVQPDVYFRSLRRDTRRRRTSPPTSPLANTPHHFKSPPPHPPPPHPPPPPPPPPPPY